MGVNLFQDETRTSNIEHRTLNKPGGSDKVEDKVEDPPTQAMEGRARLGRSPPSSDSGAVQAWGILGYLSREPVKGIDFIDDSAF